MKRLSLLAFVLTVMLVVAVARADEPQPQWLKCSDGANKHGEGFFRTTVAIDQPVTSATLRSCGDATFLAVWIGGDLIAELEPYDPLLRVDVTEHCTEGNLEIAMRLSASPPIQCAGFIQLKLKFADGSSRKVVTDDRWKCLATAPTNWTKNAFDEEDWQRPTLLGEVDDRLLIPQDRSTDIDVAENYDQWKQAIGAAEGTNPASFQLTDGFEIELLRSAHEDEDSWVSMAFDPQGRLIVAKEKVGLLRITLDDAGAISEVETVDDSMEECRGLLFIGDDLYVNANDSKGLYRLPANDKDGFSEPELIYASNGGVGHGRNDLALGPDGKIYSIQGDSVDLPNDCKDYTSPFRDARRGIKTSEGHLLRIDPKTKEVEVIAAGLRNPFGIAFNPRGDCFTYDADAEYDMGSPWYRPTRVSHLRLGSDYGWRGVTKQWPPYYPDHPDNALHGLDIGKGSPTAVEFATNSNFPPRYRDALFILDWTYGRIIAVHAIPRGSSYLMTAETFLQGRPLNVTDLDFGPDGAMYFVTGGRQTQSALYRLRYTGPQVAESKLTLQQAYRKQIATEMDARRRELESLLVEGRVGPANEPHIEDPYLRTAARNLVERTDVKQWRSLAFQERDDKPALLSMMTLARSGDNDLRDAIANRLCEIDWLTMSQSWRETATYTLWLVTRDWQPTDSFKKKLLSKLEGSYPDREYSVTRILSEILVRLDSEVVVSKSLELAATTTKQAEQMHYLFVLREAKAGWTLEGRRQYFELLATTVDYVGGQGMTDFLKKIRSDAIANLTAGERDKLAGVIETSDTQAALAQSVTASLKPRPIIKQWSLEGLTKALAKLASNGDARRGKKLFAEASCVHCHRANGFGRLIGPDLTNVSRRFSQRDLLTSIIDPSKIISEKYQSLLVATNDGKVYTGLPALGGDYRSTKLRLATNISDPYAITEIEKADIQQIQPATSSWMPNGLLNTLSARDVADLLAYLKSN